MNKHNSKGLSIQISLNGLSFCILNRKTKTVEHLKSLVFKKKATPFETLERLTTVLNTNTIFEQNFESILVIHQNELSTSVPKPLFKEDHAADYLKFNAKILNTDFIAFDEIPANNSINVFVPYVNINNYIFDQFGEFEYKHASTVLIQSLLQRENDSKQPILYVNVGKNQFELVAIDKGNLVFYNSFAYQTKEDFIYFILFTIEQLKLDPETILLTLIGEISKDDEFYEIVYKYIRFVDFMESDHHFKFEEKQMPKTSHSDYIILQSFN